MSRNRVRAAAVSVALIAAVGVTVGLTETSVSASQQTEITEFHSAHPIIGENFYVRGTISTQIERPVELQRLFHHAWKVVDTESTLSTGQFQFQTSTTVKRTFRVVAHTYTDGDVTYPVKKTAAKSITPVKDSVLVTIMPTVVHVGHIVKFTYTFSPTRIGRPLIQRTWVDGVRQSDSEGQTESAHTMTFKTGHLTKGDKGRYTFQLVAGPWNGAPSVASNKVHLTVTD